MNFAIAVAVPRERESQPAPGASLVLKLSMPNQHQFEIGKRGLRPRYEAPIVTSRLLEGGRNAGEGVLQVGAEALNDGDDRNRDAGGDETIFDGGRGRFVLEKGKREILHGKLLLVPHGDLRLPT